MSDVEFHFEGKSFVVVGASSGIGRQVSLSLAEAGAHILLVARNLEKLREVKKNFPENMEVASLDVTAPNDSDWDVLLAEFTDKYGKLDGAVYTAGILGETPLRSYDEKLARKVMDTGFWGMMRFFQAVTRNKYSKPGSSFVVMSSIAAYIGLKGSFAYSASKAAVQTAVRSMAKEIGGKKRRINSISPGLIDTEMTREAKKTDFLSEELFDGYLLGRGIPQYISNTILFLLSDAAQWITGRDIIVDGGIMLGSD